MSLEQDVLGKLQRTYGLETQTLVTPARVSRSIDKTELLAQISMETGIKDLILLEDIFHPNGRFFAHKLTPCMDSLDNLRDRYGEGFEGMLIYLDTKCFRRKTGRINERRLLKNIKKSQGLLKEF